MPDKNRDLSKIVSQTHFAAQRLRDFVYPPVGATRAQLVAWHRRRIALCLRELVDDLAAVDRKRQ